MLTVDPEALKIPTIASLRSLYDKYELDFKVAEKATAEKREAETNLINAFVATDVMAKAMKFIADKGLIPNDEFEFKDALKRIWFSQYARENNVISSSGFENVFLAEKVNTEITGLHNWIYFNEQESAGRANYLGYIKDAKLGDVSIFCSLLFPFSYSSYFCLYNIRLHLFFTYTFLSFHSHVIFPPASHLPILID